MHNTNKFTDQKISDSYNDDKVKIDTDKWKYQSITGKMNYLVMTTRPYSKFKNIETIPNFCTRKQ